MSLHKTSGKIEYHHMGRLDDIFDKKNIGELADMIKEAKALKANGQSDEITVDLANGKYTVTSETTPVTLAKQVAYNIAWQHVAGMTSRDESIGKPGNQTLDFVENLLQATRGSEDTPHSRFTRMMDTTFDIVSKATEAMPAFEQAMRETGKHTARTGVKESSRSRG